MDLIKESVNFFEFLFKKSIPSADSNSLQKKTLLLIILILMKNKRTINNLVLRVLSYFWPSNKNNCSLSLDYYEYFD